MRFLIYTCFLSAALFSSCEEVYELDVEIPFEMVIDSRIQAGNTPEVRVRVVNDRGQTVKSDLLQQSRVTIQPDGAESIDFELSSFTDSSSTFSSDFVVAAGQRYTLVIQSDGLGEVRSITDVPKNVSVRKGSGGTIGPNGGILPEGDFFYLPMAFDDEKDEDNYYHILVTIRNSDTDEQQLKVLKYGISPMPRDAKAFKDTGWMFNDKTFRNGTFDARIRILKEDVLPFSSPVVTLELRTVSVDYFNFHIQSSRPKSSGLPGHGQFGTKDNISGGGGLFGGFSSDESSYTLEF